MLGKRVVADDVVHAKPRRQIAAVVAALVIAARRPRERGHALGEP
jgi:hypothetical protein